MNELRAGHQKLLPFVCPFVCSSVRPFVQIGRRRQWLRGLDLADRRPLSVSLLSSFICTFVKPKISFLYLPASSSTNSVQFFRTQLRKERDNNDQDDANSSLTWLSRVSSLPASTPIFAPITKARQSRHSSRPPFFLSLLLPCFFLFFLFFLFFWLISHFSTDVSLKVVSSGWPACVSRALTSLLVCQLKSMIDLLPQLKLAPICLPTTNSPAKPCASNVSNHLST